MQITTDQYQKARIYLKGSLPIKDIAELTEIPLEKLKAIRAGKALAEVNNRPDAPQEKPGRPRKEIDLSTPEGIRLAKKREDSNRAYAKKIAA